jgi:imidazolonepropionase-like amidohydrolase
MSVIPWKSSFLSLFFLVGYWLTGLTPLQGQERSILLLNATAHLGNGEVIPRAAIAMRNGKIEEVLAAFDIRMDTSIYDTIIHLEGKHIYPGLIAPNSRLGLTEIDAVKSTHDYCEIGSYNPNIRTLTAYNTESRITSTVRANGVLLAEVAPTGGLISGKSSVFELDGWNWEDAVVKVDAGMHLYWPNPQKTANEEEREEKALVYEKACRKLDAFFKQAKAYGEKQFHLERNLHFEAMLPFLAGKGKLFVHANTAKAITDAIYFFEPYNVSLVIVGGYETYLLTDLLKDKNIPVLVGRVHALPVYEDDAIDLPYRLPGILQKEGILVGLENSGDMEAMGSRNLPFYAGTAIAYGVEPEDALSMITLNTAKILGISDRLGSLEKGKDATLFVSEGDALDMRSNKVSLAYIRGRKVDLNTPQKELYKRFSKRYK